MTRAEVELLLATAKGVQLLLVSSSNGDSVMVRRAINSIEDKGQALTNELTRGQRLSNS